MSTNYGFQPTLDGLNSIDSNSTTSDDIVCNTLKINVSGTAPTVSALSNDNNIATTAWVTNHAGGTYVTLNTAQTITGQKTFSNANTFITGNTVTDSIRSSSSTSAINIGQNIQSGLINLATTFIGPTMNVPLSWGTSSNQGILSLQGGSFNLFSSGNYTQRCGPTLNMTIGDSQTSGILNIATSATRSGDINFNTGATAINNINIATSRSGSGTVSIGSSSSTTNTVSIQSNTVNIGTVSPALATNTVNIGNGLSGSTVNILNRTNFTGDVSVNGVLQPTSIVTNTYNATIPTADVNINPLQTSGSLNLGTLSNRSGIIQIGNGVNATCDIRIGTQRTTGGAVSVGSNSSLSNVLNLQSNTINLGTGSPLGASNTINIGNSNTGSVINLRNDTNINTTGAGSTNIGVNTATAGTVNIRGQNINFTAYDSINLEATNAFWVNTGQGNFYFKAYNSTPQWLLGDQVSGLDYLTIQATATGSTIDALSQPLTINASQVNIASAFLTNSSVEVNVPLQMDPTFVSYPVTGTYSVGYHTSTTSTTKFTNAAANLASLSIPAAGCYLCEGQWYFSGTVYTAQAFTTISISTTSATVNTQRQQTAYQGGVGGNYAGQVTSIFNFTGPSTVYLVGVAQNTLGATSNQQNFFSITRIA